MRRVTLTLLVTFGLVALAAPAEAKSTKPAGVTTAQWVDYCDHSTDVVIALRGITDEVTANPQVAILTTYGDMLVLAGLNLHHDAAKIGGKLGTRIESLSRAVKKLANAYLATGQLKLRGLQIAADPLPDCV